MRLIQATWENFAAYVGKHFLSFDQEPGLYLVTGVNRLATKMGSNGAAKSTIFDIMAWVVWGKTFRDERPGDAIEPWSGESPTKATLRYEHLDHLFEIMRGRNPNILQYRQEEGSWSEWQVCDQAKIAEIFPLSFDIFRYSVVLPQFGELFLDLRPEEQSELFTKTLNLDLWLRAADLATALGKQAKEELERSTAELGVCIGRRREVEDAIAAELPLASSFKKTRAAEVLEKQRARASALEELAQLEAQPVDEASPVEAMEEELRGLYDFREEVAGAAAELGALVDNMDRDIDRYETLVRELSAFPEECPACHQKVSRGHFLQEIGTAEGELDGLRSLRAEVFAERADKEVVLASNRVVVAKQEQALRDARAFGQRVATARARREVAIDRKRQQAAQLKREETELQKKPNPHLETIAGLRSRLAEIDEQSVELEAKQQQVSESVAQYTYWAQAYRRIRLQLIDGVLGPLEEAANQHAEALGLEGWRLELGIEKETQSGKISHGFTCLLHPPGIIKPVKWQRYCGGEVQRLQLAVRFGLAELLLASAAVEPNLEILDEPTQHLSPEGVESLLECLRQRALKLGRQIWLVDQHVFPSDFFDGVIVVEHTAEGSRIKLNSA